MKKTIATVSVAVVAAGSILYSAYKEEIDGAIATPYCWATVERVEGLIKSKAEVSKIDRVVGRMTEFCQQEVPIRGLKKKFVAVSKKVHKLKAKKAEREIEERIRMLEKVSPGAAKIMREAYERSLK